MNTFIEKNEKLLKFYSVSARIIGWLILILGGLGILMLLIKQYQVGFGKPVIIAGPQGVFQRSWFILVATGLTLLGVAQFMRYLFDSEYHLSWLLRYADKMFYVFAFFVAWKMVGMIIFYFSRGDIVEVEVWLLNIIPMVLFNLARILALVGLAQILKRVLPVIEEHKSLV